MNEHGTINSLSDALYLVRQAELRAAVGPSRVWLFLAHVATHLQERLDDVLDADSPFYEEAPGYVCPSPF